MKRSKSQRSTARMTALFLTALAAGITSPILLTADKSLGLKLGNNCEVPDLDDASPALLRTLYRMWKKQDLDKEDCDDAAQQLAESAGKRGATSSITAVSGGTTQPTAPTAPTAPAPTNAAADANSDSDGDGESDATDRDPLIANVPFLSYGIIGDTVITYDLAEQTAGQDKTASVTLGRESATTSEKTNTSTYTNEISASVTASYSPLELGVEASVGYSHTWENSYTNTEIQESRNKYESVGASTVSQNNLTRGGTIAISVEIKNEGTAPIGVGDVRVAARRRTGSGANQFKDVATLVPIGTFKRDLAPGEKMDVQVSAKIENITLIRDLLGAPESLYFEVTRPDLNLPSDGTEAALQRSFANRITAVENKTVQINIDYGRGYSRAYHVAAGKGITFADVMKILNLKYATEGDRLTALCKERGSGDCPARELVKTDVEQGMDWGGRFVKSRNRSERLVIAPAGKLEATELEAGDVVLLAFIEDRDKDGLSRNEEVRYKTVDDPKECPTTAGCKDAKDFDGDGISDFDEARTGWQLGTANKTQVFSAPSLADVDADGWDDKTEMAKQTNPNSKDTDGDKVADNQDPNPLVADAAPVAAAPVAAAPAKLEIKYFEDVNQLSAHLRSKNLARFRTGYLPADASMSSILANNPQDWGPGKALDGDLNTMAHTAEVAERRLLIELKKAQPVRTIVIWNRTDECCRRRVQDQELVFYDGANERVGEAIPLWKGRDFIQLGKQRVMVVELPATMPDIRSVVIQGTPGNNTALNIIEVEIYGVSPTSAIPPSFPSLITGTWEGTYICNRSRGALKLMIAANSETDIKAVFEFSLGSSGSFNTVGIYKPLPDGTDSLYLDATTWIKQPSGYAMVDLDGKIVGNRYTGNVRSSNCQTFEVTKVGN